MTGSKRSPNGCARSNGPATRSRPMGAMANAKRSPLIKRKPWRNGPETAVIQIQDKRWAEFRVSLAVSAPRCPGIPRGWRSPPPGAAYVRRQQTAWVAQARNRCKALSTKGIIHGHLPGAAVMAFATHDLLFLDDNGRHITLRAHIHHLHSPKGRDSSRPLPPV